MTNQKENRVASCCNAVLVRSEADSNRCTRFCRPLPSHSAIRPCRPIGMHDPRKRGSSCRECKYTNISRLCKKSAPLLCFAGHSSLCRRLIRPRQGQHTTKNTIFTSSGATAEPGAGHAGRAQTARAARNTATNRTQTAQDRSRRADRTQAAHAPQARTRRAGPHASTQTGSAPDTHDIHRS